MGLSRLFRSRWAALFWSAGIIWTTYDVAGDAPQPTPPPGNPRAKMPVAVDATGEAFDAHDRAILANAGG